MVCFRPRFAGQQKKKVGAKPAPTPAVVEEEEEDSLEDTDSDLVRTLLSALVTGHSLSSADDKLTD